MLRHLASEKGVTPMTDTLLTLPYAATVEDAATLSGLSRTALYGLLADGTIQGKKRGRKTLIVMGSVVRHIDSLMDFKPRTAA